MGRRADIVSDRVAHLNYPGKRAQCNISRTAEDRICFGLEYANDLNLAPGDTLRLYTHIDERELVKALRELKAVPDRWHRFWFGVNVGIWTGSLIWATVTFIMR